MTKLKEMKLTYVLYFDKNENNNSNIKNENFWIASVNPLLIKACFMLNTCCNEVE